MVAGSWRLHRPCMGQARRLVRDGFLEVRHRPHYKLAKTKYTSLSSNLTNLQFICMGDVC